MLAKRHEVVGLPAPLDRFLYDTERAKWPRYLLYPLDRALLGLRGLWLARRHHAEAVFCESSHHAFPGLWIARMLRIRCIWDSHGNMRIFSLSMGKGRVFSTLTSALERFLGKRVDALVTVTERDASAYAEMGIPRGRIHVVPTCADLAHIGQRRSKVLEGARLRDGDRRTLLFFGSFRYEPNREALEFINSHLAPFLETRGIGCEIRIAGRDIPRWTFHPTIRTLGFVDDIYQEIRSVDLCIVPVWRGVGMLVKVIDVMAAGTPAVISEFAASGFPEVQDRVHAFIAPVNSFGEVVTEALSNPEKLEAVAEAGRSLVAQRYNWALFEPLIESILNQR